MNKFQPEHVNEPKQHYHLIAAQVLYVDPESGNTGAANFNTMVTTDDGNVGVRHINKAQQLVQVLFFQRMGTTAYKVLDVFIMNVCHLGKMTQAQFTKDPAGSMMQVVDFPTPGSGEALNG